MTKPQVLPADEDGIRRKNLRGILRHHTYVVLDSSRLINFKFSPLILITSGPLRVPQTLCTRGPFA